MFILNSEQSNLTDARWLGLTLLLLAAAVCMGLGVVVFGALVPAKTGFPHVLGTPYGQVQDYAFTLNHEDCGIVIYGDSSAMTADDPATIEATTHLKTCNISQTQPIVLVSGMTPVDLYLRKNKLPRYLVIQVAPETFFQSHSLDRVAIFDPMTFMLRQHRGTNTALSLLKYPQQTMQYVSLALQDWYLPARGKNATFFSLYAGPIAEYYRSRGLMTLPKPAETGCMEPRKLDEVANFGWVEEARRRYSRAGVNVLVTASPIPECDAQAAIYREALSGHLDGGVVSLPLSLFNDSDRHFTKVGAMVVSEALGKRILALEEQKTEAVTNR